MFWSRPSTSPAALLMPTDRDMACPHAEIRAAWDHQSHHRCPRRVAAPGEAVREGKRPVPSVRGGRGPQARACGECGRQGVPVAGPQLRESKRRRPTWRPLLGGSLGDDLRGWPVTPDPWRHRERILLSPDGLARVAELVRHPPQPTPELVDLMRGAPEVQAPGNRSCAVGGSDRRDSSRSLAQESP